MTNTDSVTQKLLKKYYGDTQHVKQVETYCVKLYDALVQSGILNFSQREKEYLQIAALLHDIGYFVEKKAHHKHSMKLIINDGIEGFEEQEVKIIANIARYHRASFPNEEKHKNYASLSNEQKELVQKLGSVLRIADGMDKPQKNLILAVQVNETESTINFFIKTVGYKPKLQMAKEKSDLFEEVFKKEVKFLFL